jgi:hypothetical protein
LYFKQVYIRNAAYAAAVCQVLNQQTGRLGKHFTRQGFLRIRLIYITVAGLFIMSSLNVFSQKQKPKNDSWYDDKLLHFGFSLGMNLMDFDITPSQSYLDTDGYYPEVSILNPGINIQVVTNLRPARYLDLRFLPGVSFGQRNVRYYDYDTGAVISDNQRVESSFLEFPFLLKYKGERLNNVRPYIIGGFNYRYDLAGKKEYNEEKQVYIRLKRSDLYYEAGAGLDFYLPYFKLSVEIKTSRGIRDVIVHEDLGATGYPQYANAVEKMMSRIWIIAFHFE